MRLASERPAVGAGRAWPRQPERLQSDGKTRSAARLRPRGVLELTDDAITIRREGFASLLLHGLKGDKIIPLESITAVQFRAAGTLVNGYIQFSILGGVESRRGVFDAAADENTVVFTDREEPDFRRLHRELERYRQERRRGAAATMAGATPMAPASRVASEIEQLERLVSLRERGVLSDAQFERKKREILGE